MNEFIPGSLVIITAKDYFRGTKLAYVVDKDSTVRPVPAKWCPDGIPVVLVEKEEGSVRTVCIREKNGDTIKVLAKNRG